MIETYILRLSQDPGKGRTGSRITPTLARAVREDHVHRRLLHLDKEYLTDLLRNEMSFRRPSENHLHEGASCLLYVDLQPQQGCHDIGAADINH